MGVREKIARIKTEGFPPPVPLDDTAISRLAEGQVALLRTLAELAEKEHDLSEQINARRPTPDGVLRFPDGSITVCEDEDDFMVITTRHRNELARVQAAIKAKLEEAIGLDMAHLGIIQRQCANYGVI